MMNLSIITVCYNNALGLQATLNSVAVQTVSEGVEHIIVDGGSTDGSVDVIRGYVQKMEEEERRDKEKERGVEVKWVSEKDKGIYNAMNKGIEIALGKRKINEFNRSELVEDKNKGIEMATGDYCLFLNSGDVLARPDVLSRILPILNDNPSTINNKHIACDIYYGDVVKVKEVGRYTLKRKLTYKDVLSAQDFFSKYPCIHHQAAFIKKELFSKYCEYREDLYLISDWAFFFKAILENHATYRHISMVIAICDMTGASNSYSLENPKIKHDLEVREDIIEMYCKSKNVNVKPEKNTLYKGAFTKLLWKISAIVPIKFYLS